LITVIRKKKKLRLLNTKQGIYVQIVSYFAYTCELSIDKKSIEDRE